MEMVNIDYSRRQANTESLAALLGALHRIRDIHPELKDDTDMIYHKAHDLHGEIMEYEEQLYSIERGGSLSS